MDGIARGSKKSASFYRFLGFLFLLLIPATLQAQLNNDYFKADQLLQQQKYEEAFERFSELYKENPGTYIILEKATECLINLKEYEKAIELVERGINKGYYQAQGNIRIGEIYHISGDTTQAYKIWDRTLDRFGKDNMQVRLALARTMEERRIFDRAIDLYLEIRSAFQNSSMITSELANTYLQAGEYEEAIREFLQLVKNNPDRISHVQNRLIRFQDDYIYDVAILEIEEFLEDLSMDNSVRQNLQQLELWLLMERGLYERAVAKAKNYEGSTANVNYLLYSLGARLLADQKYELAKEAYSYYVDNNIQPAKFRSMEELANVYMEWAAYLENYNLAFSSKRDSLYQRAFDTLAGLKQIAPNYQRMNHVLITQADLALDFLHHPEQAGKNLEELREYSESSFAAEEYYIDGRLKLYEGEYSRARISLTRSNKEDKSNAFKEKTRYYLALTDFFSGDYEFAQVQLKALERQNTSYFANDAIQLRLWIQQGLQADSTGSILQPFARAVEQFSQGKSREAVHSLKEIVQPNSYNPLADEALLQLSTYIDSDLAMVTYLYIDQYLEAGGQSSPLYERLLWEKARIADQVVTHEQMQNITWTRGISDMFPDEQSFEEATFPETRDELLTLYEDILMKFPNGFYAPHARERIQELEEMQT